MHHQLQNLLNVPPELQGLRQWCVSTMEPLPLSAKPDKSPRSSFTGHSVSPTDPAGWSTFQDAYLWLQGRLSIGMPGAVGFCLTAQDPYAVIDLDRNGAEDESSLRAQDKIYEVFTSYSERSVSGRGCHIIVRGVVGGGCRRGGVEVYDRERYMLTTGDVARPLPINPDMGLLDRLIGEIRPHFLGTADLPEDQPATLEDRVVIWRLEAAYNSDKFKDLYYRSPSPHEDWSVRDAALAEFLVYQTRNHDQLLRLFRGSALYRPDGKRKSVAFYEQDYLLKRTFGKALSRAIAEEQAESLPNQVVTDTVNDIIKACTNAS